MTISNVQAAKFALIPGNIESFEKRTNQGTLIGLDGTVKLVKQTRDFFYLSILFTGLSSILGITSDENTSDREYTAYMVCVGGGIIITLLAALQLYRFTSALQRVYK